MQDLVDSKNASDVHRLEDNEASRALARATIASIAAASTGHSAPEVTVDGQVIAPAEGGEPVESGEQATTAEASADASTETGDTAVGHSGDAQGE